MSIETFCKAVAGAVGPLGSIKKTLLDETLRQFAEYVKAERRPKKKGPITGVNKPAEPDDDEVQAKPKARVNTAAKPARKEHTMDIYEAARRVAKGDSTTATRKDFYRAIEKLADDYRRDHPLERLTKERAFAKVVDTPDGRVLFRAYSKSPGDDLDLATPKAPDPTPVAPSLAKLNDLAAKCRADSPALTFEQAFTKVYEDPANRELVAAEKVERRRPA
jgi:hypothetical protein